MPRFLEPAFVLRKWDTGESDQIVSLLTRGRGRVKGIAKGSKRSKKRFGGLLSPFMLIHVEYVQTPNRELVRIENCSLIRYFSGIHEDLKRLLIGCNLIEIMERVLPEGDSTGAFFDLMVRGLSCLEKEEDVSPLLAVFLLKVLTLIGMQPQVFVCVHCRRRLGPTGIFGFSVPEGGAVCGSCARRGTITHRISSNALVLLQSWRARQLDEFCLRDTPHSAAQEAEKTLSSFLSYHVGRDLRSLQVFQRIFGSSCR